MANHISHSALPYPVKNARFSVIVPFLDATGSPTDPTTPDTEVSKDAGAFADCVEEVTTISGSNGMGYLTLSGAETNCSLLALAAKVASGPKPTLMTLFPRVLPIVTSGTAQAGAAGTLTLASGAPAYDLSGCIVRTTGGTGGGGTGGANNQARIITAYNTSTKVATIEPSWETTPDGTTTYDVLQTEAGGKAAVLSVLLDATNGLSAIKTALNTVDDFVDTEVAAILAAAVAIKAKTDLLPSAPAATGDIPTAAAVATAVWNVLLSTLTTTSSIGKKLADWVLGTDNRGLISANSHTAGVTVLAVTGNVGGTVGALAAQAKADVNAEVVDVLRVDVASEPGVGAPPASPTMEQMIHHLYQVTFNQIDRSAGLMKVYLVDGVTVAKKAVISVPGAGVTRRARFESGP